MLDVASMGLHVAQMTSLKGMQHAYDAVTVNGAKALGLKGYGLEPGSRADIVILQAKSPIEALQLKPARLFVIRNGDVIARTPLQENYVTFGGKEELVSFSKGLF